MTHPDGPHYHCKWCGLHVIWVEARSCWIWPDSLLGSVCWSPDSCDAAHEGVLREAHE